MNKSEFHCRCCGACCRIKDGIVRVSDAEISRIAAYLGIDETEFIANEAELAPDRKGLMLKSRADGACVYLDENNLCRLNPVKPDKCRSFPFEWTNPDSNDVCPELARLKQEKRGLSPRKCVLFCLGMQDDMAQVAAADLQGRDIQDARLLRRRR